MNLFIRIWNDPVWSKVIASIIIALIPLIVSSVSKNNESILNSVVSKPVVIIVLIILIIILLLVTITGSVFKGLGADKIIIRKIYKEKYSKYWFLFWYVINHTISSERLLQSQSLNNIPEMNELYRKSILKDVMASLTQYTIDVDKNVYDILESKYDKLFNNNLKFRAYVINFSHKKFQEIFR